MELVRSPRITSAHMQYLKELESQVHYRQPPPPGCPPYHVVRGQIPILISAPHGARTFRNRKGEKWHKEDAYTAGMALLLARICNVSAIATMWRTDDSDPNDSLPEASSYKQIVRDIVRTQGIRWVVDLHGAGCRSLPPPQSVDLGTRKDLLSLPPTHLKQFVHTIEFYLGPGSVSHNRYPARVQSRTITAYCHGDLGISAVQVEMKPEIRIPDYDQRELPYDPHPVQNVRAMLQALCDFITHLPQ